ncbi:helix-turn-helix transcriptional regulator [Rubrimonas sp.]|uniref:helix-turn-helix transcriptional regulator n=1 Tax=Rubrimonas sp. TaxID=2036015 RepID=UPI002FDDC761
MKPLVPTIRAGALAPILGWMAKSGRPVEAALRDAALGEQAVGDPDSPVPLLNAIELLRGLARAEGPDIACRVASGIEIQEIGALGAAIRARPTPRQALHVVSVLMPRHCTHERFTVENTASGVRVIESWSVRFDAEALHLAQQYVAALIRALCAATRGAAPLLDRVEIPPHPSVGVAHLARWLGRVEAAAAPRLVVEVPARVADARLAPLTGAHTPPPEWTTLHADGDLLQSLRWTIAAMLGPEEVSLDSVAAAAGVTRRTLQRRLAAEGLTFSELLDGTRLDLAIRLLTQSAAPLGEVASRLGYANAPALTRAVRRWTGATPRAVREKGAAGLQGRNAAAGNGGAKR